MMNSQVKTPEINENYGMGYYTCLLTNQSEAEGLLRGVTLANFTPASEQTLYSEISSCFRPEKVKLSELCVGQHLWGHVLSVERTGLRLDLGLPFTPFIHKKDFNGVSATCQSVLEVEIISTDLVENLVALKIISNVSVTDNQINNGHPSISSKMTCSLCGITFGSRDEQVLHYKLDWHRYNLKQRILGEESVSEVKFNEMSEVISSLSGSDSEDAQNGDESSETGSETGGSPKRKLPLSSITHSLRSRHRSASVTSTDDTEGENETEIAAARARMHTKVFLRNSQGDIVSLYRCLLHNKNNAPESPNLLMSLVNSLLSRLNWAIILIGGGHFAAAVYNRNEVITHKTLHRYTVRAKQGGAQCTRDSRGGASKSAGASLRRYNEACLIKEVQDCLGSWSKELSGCHTLFIRAPSFNRVALFGSKSPPFQKDDPRLRTIPFATRRATYKEVQRVHSVLSTIECLGPESQFDVSLVNSSPTKKPKPKAVLLKLPAKEELSAKRDATLSSDIKDHLSEEDEVDADSEPELTVQEETILTSELQEMSVSCKRPLRKRRRKPKGIKRQQDPGTPVGEENERYQLKNALYSACSAGDITQVQCLLSKLVDLGTKPSQPSPSPQATPTLDLRLNEKSNVDTSPGNYPSPTDSEIDFPSVILKFNAIVCPTPICPQVEPLEQTKEEILKDILNEPLGDFGATLLHVSAKEGHKDMVKTLLELGADPTVKNKQGFTPYVLASEKETRTEFRLFWGSNPDRYDYTRSQIPSPLTATILQNQQEKETEKRKEKKKEQRNKAKGRKAVEEALRKETEEKTRFLGLSDREKRAVAAEKRLLSSNSKPSIPISRCFECGSDITGQIPFEYSDNRFCSTKCVKVHRKKSTAAPFI